MSTVQCATHGDRQETFLCSHFAAGGVGLDFIEMRSLPMMPLPTHETRWKNGALAPCKNTLKMSAL